MLQKLLFLSTPSARRATQQQERNGRHEGISIHALREEGDGAVPRGVYQKSDFYPRPPRGGRPGMPRPLRTVCGISIHALREEGDIGSLPPGSRFTYFYPRPPRGGRPTTLQTRTKPRRYFYPRPPRGGRPSATGRLTVHSRFLSTPSARRATAKTETKSLFSNKLYNILHEFRRALIYNGSKNYPNHAK